VAIIKSDFSSIIR